ncbi:H-NS family histone-like protein [Actinobacillus delphinicola]|uniref:DNA-binding protein n=1 Tax=Actinobacillus delphinicola TaxID=51161 RepID=A0A448TVN1_9PAST|nr:H-NS family nucleoid-associated regulatory protein [Actinobacillus delphinicola]VEJ09991.1 histone family protein nucleoid-structuring protein H-NS [Actinobacillus delphinicola]
MENLIKVLNNKRSLRRVINEMSLDDAESCLLKLQEIIEERRAENEKIAQQLAEKERAVSELREKMATLGISIEDLGGNATTRSSKKGTKVPAKYEWMDAEGTIHQWTGRGNMPLSLKAEINDHNKTLEDFLIK